MDNMDKRLEGVQSTGNFVCFCVSMELNCIATFVYHAVYLNATAQIHSDFFAYIFLCYGPRFVRNEDVLDLDTSFERLDVHVICDCNSK